MPLRRRWKVLFYIVTATIFTVLLLRLPLFLSRQVVPHTTLPLICPETRNGSQLGRGEEYVFTMVVYSLLFIGRFLESFILQIQIHKFFFKDYKETDPLEFVALCIKGLTQKKWITTCFVVLSVYMLAHSLSIPALGIALEIRTGRATDCESYVYEYHTVYWILDTIRYMYDVGIRLFMVLAMLAVGLIWFEKDVENKDIENRDIENNYTQPENTHSGEPKSYKEYLKDREITSESYSTAWKDYVDKGRRVEYILEIFQTWFVLPWVLFSISSSLSSDHILKAWKEKPSGDGEYDFSEIVYMVYNFNQLFLLTLPYLCAKKINTDHCDYVFESRTQQLDAQTSASRLAFTHINKIQEEDHFYFTPRIWGTSIKIQVDNPLYIMFLLVGIFFTITEALI